MIYLKYLRYLVRHKWYVLVECWRWGNLWRGLVHDLSKFRPDEFIPYARYFYGAWLSEDQLAARARATGYLSSGPSVESVQRDFDLAWLKHQHRNPHHWQYWVLRYDDGTTRVLTMPTAYIHEMIADWRGAGRAIGKETWGDTLEWYYSNRGQMIMDSVSRAWVEVTLNRWAQIARSR